MRCFLAVLAFTWYNSQSSSMGSFGNLSFASLVSLLDVFALSVVSKAVVRHVKLGLQHFGKEQLKPIRKEPAARW
jgi:hypothetical protein